MKTIQTLRILINILFYTLIGVFIIGALFFILLIFSPETLPAPLGIFKMMLNQPFGWKIYLVPISTVVNYILLIIAVFLLRRGTASFLVSDFYNEKVTTNFKKAGNIFVFIGLSNIVIQLFVVLYIQNLASNMLQMGAGFLISTLNTLAAVIDLKSTLAIIIGLFFLLFSKIFENSRLLKQENDLTI